MIVTVPPFIKRVFNNAPEPVSSEERLWRERAARMTLDALGHTNLTMKPTRHNEAVRYARRWYRGLYENHPNPKQVDNPSAVFDAANLISFKMVRECVLAAVPFLFAEKEEPDEQSD